MKDIKIINERQLFGLVDEERNEILPCIYHAVFRITKELIGYRTGIRWGIIKINGEIVIPPVLDGYIEDVHLSEDYTFYIESEKPLHVENPFIYKLNNNYLKSYVGSFIEEILPEYTEGENYDGENYIICKDNLGKFFICDLNGNILLHENLDTIWKIDMDSWFVIFKDGYGNIWNCRTKEYKLQSYIPAYNFHYDEHGGIYFFIDNVRYLIDGNAPKFSSLTIINTNEGEEKWYPKYLT